MPTTAADHPAEICGRLRKRGKNARGAIEDVFSIVPGKPSSMDVEGMNGSETAGRTHRTRNAMPFRTKNRAGMLRLDQ
jgi:hypothetical protein